MSDQEKALSKYVEKMYQVQYQEEEDILTPEELKKVAMDMGVTEEEWEASQESFKGHLANGKVWVQQRNWNDAVNALDQATSLNPYHLDALQSYGQALLGRFNHSGNEADAVKAREIVNRSLKVKPGNSVSLQLLTQLSSGSEALAVEKKQKSWVKYAVIGVAASIFVLSVIGMRNSVATQDEEVKQAWAQVENVYQRRADLIPNLVSTVKGAVKSEQQALERLAQLRTEVSNMGISPSSSQEEINRFSEKQRELGQTVQVVLSSARQSQRLQATQAFRDLMIQLEGSENRIATERRKFNQAVQGYNTKIRSFPYSIFYSTKPYFQADKGAMDNPNVEF